LNWNVSVLDNLREKWFASKIKLVSRSSQQFSLSGNLKSVSPPRHTNGMRVLGYLQKHWDYNVLRTPWARYFIRMVRMWVLTEINFAKHINARGLWIAVNIWIHLLYLIIFVFLPKYLLFCNVFITLNWNARQSFDIHNSSMPADTGIPSTADILSNTYSVSLTTGQKTIWSTSKTNIV